MVTRGLSRGAQLIRNRTGWMTGASSLTRRVAAIVRRDRVAAFKIGITDDPDRRWREAYKDEYDEMVLVYWSVSDTVARDVERDLIEWFCDRAENLRSGGGGPPGRRFRRYVYVVIRRL